MGHQRDLDRFMKYVEVGESCWLWTGAKLPRGYGRFYFDGKPRYAHRISLTLHGMAVPDDAMVLHSCDNPSCVNPSHLSAGTQTENMQDASSKGRIVRVGDWRGPRNPKAKLSDERRAALVAEIEAGAGTRDLAFKYQLSRVRIQQIKREVIAVTAKAKKLGGGWAVEEF